MAPTLSHSGLKPTVSKPFLIAILATLLAGNLPNLGSSQEAQLLLDELDRRVTALELRKSAVGATYCYIQASAPEDKSVPGEGTPLSKIDTDKIISHCEWAVKGFSQLNAGDLKKRWPDVDYIDGIFDEYGQARMIHNLGRAYQADDRILDAFDAYRKADELGYPYSAKAISGL